MMFSMARHPRPKMPLPGRISDSGVGNKPQRPRLDLAGVVGRAQLNRTLMICRGIVENSDSAKHTTWIING